jgi:competence protein ComEC
VLCDAAGCAAKFKDGRLATVALSIEAFAEDCTRATVVVSAREAPGDCAAILIDRKVWRTNGAVALRWMGDHFEQSNARPPGHERPWARAPRSVGDSTTAPIRPTVPDATPRSEDREPDD